MSAEEALARAKAIAAKLSGGGTATAAGASNSNKRSRWGLAPGSNTGGTTTTGSHKRPATSDDVEKATKRVWISTTEERPAAHFRAFLNPRLPDLVSQLVDQKEGNNGKDNEETCTVELQGRGSGGKPPLPGMPLEPLHIWLEGTPGQLSQAEILVDALLQEAETAPIEEEAIRADKEAEENKKYQLATVASNGGTSAYRPASVALLIGQAANPEAHLRLANEGPWIETSMEVPSGLVGYIIGKGGENVARVQAQTGARLQIQREVDLLPGQTTRTISISAPTEQAASDCQRFIENIVAEKSRQMGGTGASGSSSNGALSKDMQRVQEAINAGHEHIVVKVPDEDVGLIIGKGGATIRSLQERSGAAVQVLSNSDAEGMRQVHVTHPETAGAMLAKGLIEDILKSKAAKKEQQPENAAAQTTIEVHIPDSDVGLCIGRQGSVIRYMQQTTNTRIQIPSQCNPGEMHRVATVSGPEEGCAKAKQMIQRIVTEQSSAGVMSGQPPAQQQYYQQQRQQQQFQQPTEGQQGYSAEWAAYYAAQQAAAAQQEQHQQQQREQQASGYNTVTQHPTQYHGQPQPQQQHQAATGTAATPAADAYYEEFFRYAYYYGEPAARQHYGAWSPPPGTTNPYGINPNGIQPAPAPTAAATATGDGTAATTAAAAAPAPATAPRSDARETSRRAVSNLPAWMTKK